MRSLTDHGRARNGTLLEARDAGPGSTRRSGGDRAGERGGTVGPGHVGLMERLEAVAAEVAAEWSGRTAGQGVISGDELVRMRRVVNRLEAAFTGATRLFDRSQEWVGRGGGLRGCVAARALSAVAAGVAPACQGRSGVGADACYAGGVRVG